MTTPDVFPKNAVAGIVHPENPLLRIPLVAAMGPDGSVMGSNIVIDSTGKYAFDIGSLPNVPTYENGLQVAIVYGPDRNGRSIRQTSAYVNGVWMGDSQWELV